MEDKRRYQCDQCSQVFKREDHLARHKLSHGEARFRCMHSDCGMTFHRKDVLHRHEKVHQPDPNIRRRRPRRGAEPKPFIANKNLSSDYDQSDSQAGGSSCTSSPGFITATSLREQHSEEDTLAGLPLDALAFCSLHFVQSCIRRFPFIHWTCLDTNGMMPEKLLAMAVLGGCAIREYKPATRKFFERAQLLLLQRSVKPETNTTHHPEPTSEPQQEDLNLFQAQVLLIEYAIWCPHTEYQPWAERCASRLANDVVPRFINHLNQLHHMKAGWLGWIHQEQCVRTLWAFYCTLQKARPVLSGHFDLASLRCELWLPRSRVAFEARDEAGWQHGLDFSLSLSRMRTSYIMFEVAFSELLEGDAGDYGCLKDIGPLGRHVLLSALLEQYLEALQRPENFETVDAFDAQNLSRFKPRPALLGALGKCRRLWWIDPAVCFGATPPRSADLQNDLLLCYLEVLLLGGKDDRVVPKDDYVMSLMIPANILNTMVQNGVVEVATKAPWLTDGASEYFVLEFSSLSLRWARSIQRCSSVSDLHPGDRAIYDHFRDALQGFRKQLPDVDRDLDLEDIRSMEKLLFDAWSIILVDKARVPGI